MSHVLFDGPLQCCAGSGDAVLSTHSFMMHCSLLDCIKYRIAPGIAVAGSAASVSLVLDFTMHCVVFGITLCTACLGCCAGSAAAMLRMQGLMMHCNLFDCLFGQLHQCRIAFLLCGCKVLGHGA